MDDKDFQNRLNANPNDTVLRAKYIEWLNNQGDIRGKYALLMAQQLQLRTDLKCVDNELRDLEWRINSSWLEAMFPLVIRSPMVGRFYPAPSPDLPPYVQPGEFVAAGTIVCLIEVMMIFNEIRADTSGVLMSAMVQAGDAVEYDQPIFSLRRWHPDYW